ncbi:MAG: hypothetical protein OJF62_003216 [Pseudolabrys sp.]|nr:hypothetical protein [Pseudolabrys sp.]
MYRVLFVLSGALLLAGCTSSSNWFDALKPEPIKDTVRFESEPPGADVTVGTLTCKTPCQLDIPTNAAASATFALNGYQPDTEQLDLIAAGDGTSKFNPNPVVAELQAVPPPKKPAHKRKPAAKKPAAKKPVAKKPAPAPKPAAAAPAAAAPAVPPPPQEAPVGSSPWPASPSPAQQQ